MCPQLPLRLENEAAGAHKAEQTVVHQHTVAQRQGQGDSTSVVCLLSTGRNSWVCVCRKCCRRFRFCQNQPEAVCWPCWTDGPTGASPDSAAGGSPSPSSITRTAESLSLTSESTPHRPTGRCEPADHESDLCRDTVTHIAELFKEKGSDCWWELPIETLLPPNVLKKVRKQEQVTSNGADPLSVLDTTPVLEPLADFSW